MLRIFLALGLVGAALASSTDDNSTSASCLSLQNSCNANTVDLSNFYNYVPCIMLTTCMQGVENPAQVLQASGAPANQPRLMEEVGAITRACLSLLNALRISRPLIPCQGETRT